MIYFLAWVLQAIVTFKFATQTHDTLLLRGISYL